MEVTGMRRRSAAYWLGALTLAVMLLAGCAKEQPKPAGSSSSAAEEARAQTDSLRLEFAPTGRESMTLLQALERLQKKLPEVFTQVGADVDSVTLTVGSSVSATGQALAEGSIDAALFPSGQALASFGAGSCVLATRGFPAALHSGTSASDWNRGENAWTDSQTPGQRMLICAGPSEYGRSLAQRVQNGASSLTWEELSRARWAVAGEGKALASLWLSDHYDGSVLADLPQCTDCESYETALASLADETADLAVIPADLRVDLADRWTMDLSHTAEDGAPGWGRGDSVWEEVTVVGVSEPLYAQTLSAAAQSPWAEEPLASALIQALSLLEEDSDFQTMGGNGLLVELSDSNLDSARRLAALEEEP